MFLQKFANISSPSFSATMTQTLNWWRKERSSDLRLYCCCVPDPSCRIQSKLHYRISDGSSCVYYPVLNGFNSDVCKKSVWMKHVRAVDLNFKGILMIKIYFRLFIAWDMVVTKSHFVSGQIINIKISK